MKDNKDNKVYGVLYKGNIICKGDLSYCAKTCAVCAIADPDAKVVELKSE